LDRCGAGDKSHGWGCAPAIFPDRGVDSDWIAGGIRLGLARAVEPMTLAPLLNAAPLVQVHAFAALGAVAVGTVQFVAPKGLLPHRALGWTWVALIVVMLVSAFFNHDILPWDMFGPSVCCRAGEACDRGSVTCASIHLLSLYFLLILPYAVLHAHRHDVIRHRQAMRWLFLGMLLIGTALTFLPHRIMHEVAFGL
jgi:uncharacterized membrane protein